MLFPSSPPPCLYRQDGPGGQTDTLFRPVICSCFRTLQGAPFSAMALNLQFLRRRFGGHPGERRQVMWATIIFAQEAADGAAAVGGLLGGLMSMMCLVWTFALVATVFWLVVLVDALVNEPTPNDKILWFLVIFFL